MKNWNAKTKERLAKASFGLGFGVYAVSEFPQWSAGYFVAAAIIGPAILWLHWSSLLRWAALFVFVLCLFKPAINKKRGDDYRQWMKQRIESQNVKDVP